MTKILPIKRETIINKSNDVKRLYANEIFLSGTIKSIKINPFRPVSLNARGVYD